MACHANKHEISGHRHNQLVCPMKDPLSWLHISTRVTDGNHFKIFSQSVQKTRREGKKRKKNLKSNCNAYCVCVKRLLRLLKSE